MRTVATLSVLLASLAIGALSVRSVPAQTTKTGYKIEMVRVSGSAWDALRYDAASGRTWRVVAGKWLPLSEDGEVPAGSYELHTVGLDGDWGAVRLDTTSGRTWAAREGGWVEIKE